MQFLLFFQLPRGRERGTPKEKVSPENRVTAVRGGARSSRISGQTSAREQVTGLRTLDHGTSFALRGYSYSPFIGISGGLRRKCCLGSVVVVVHARALFFSRVFMKPGVALASYASWLGPVCSDRSESSVICQTCNKSYESDVLQSHRTRRYSCTRDHFPRLVLARQLISHWWACPQSTISTLSPTFS